MRQKGDVKFINALNNLAICQMTHEDVDLINERIVMEKDVPKNSIHLFYENTDVDEYNEKKINNFKGIVNCIHIKKLL